ncbi:MAG: hypothetical protein MHM6MM_003482 [Cercozoa sp. M6MM]
MASLWPQLEQALQQYEEPYLLRAAAGAISDIACALQGPRLQPYVHKMMDLLHHALTSEFVDTATLPHIVGTVTQIAIELGPAFEAYLSHAVIALGNVMRRCMEQVQELTLDALDTLNHLRESVLAFYSAALQGLDKEHKGFMFTRYMADVMNLLGVVAASGTLDAKVVCAACDLITDIFRVYAGNQQVLERVLSVPTVTNIVRRAINTNDERTSQKALEANRAMAEAGYHIDLGAGGNVNTFQQQQPHLFSAAQQQQQQQQQPHMMH